MNEEIDKFLAASTDCDDIALLITVENMDYLFKILNEYEIYNAYVRKLFDICDYSVDEVEKSLIFITSVKAITKEIVHDNLSLNNPVQFKSHIQNAPYTALIMEYIDDEHSFITRYKEQKNIENSQKPKR